MKRDSRSHGPCRVPRLSKPRPAMGLVRAGKAGPGSVVIDVCAIALPRFPVFADSPIRSETFGLGRDAGWFRSRGPVAAETRLRHVEGCRTRRPTRAASRCRPRHAHRLHRHLRCEGSRERPDGFCCRRSLRGRTGDRPRRIAIVASTTSRGPGQAGRQAGRQDTPQKGAPLGKTGSTYSLERRGSLVARSRVPSSGGLVGWDVGIVGSVAGGGHCEEAVVRVCLGRV